MIFISLIFSFYRHIVSPVLHAFGAQFFVQPGCRYYPSCSVYALGAFKRHGMLRGTIKSMGRICSCYVFHRGGYDPA